jgi:hypothetical protein
MLGKALSRFSPFRHRLAICLLQLFNPNLETPTSELLEMLNYLFESQRDAKYSFVIENVAENELLALTVATKIGFYNFHWTFACLFVGNDDEQSRVLLEHFHYPLMVRFAFAQRAIRLTPNRLSTIS